MSTSSAGLLMYRVRAGTIEVLLVHPGGPFWATRDTGAWSIPKGELNGGDPQRCAAREFEEELGQAPPRSGWIDLGEVIQRGGKRVHCWAVEGDLDTEAVTSNTFEMEWPPHSGRWTSFPEVDRASWCSPEEATHRLVPAQVALVERLLTQVNQAK